MTLDDMLARSCDNNIGLIIALVCDIALHNNKKLAHPQAYDKDFNKYVANLFHEYCLDGAYSQYIHLAQEIIPVPEFLTKPKYALIHTHTARRTAATLMYLAGMDVFNICSVTGHSSIAMLKKYIKADEIERARTISSDAAFSKW
jgi:integrase